MSGLAPPAPHAADGSASADAPLWSRLTLATLALALILRFSLILCGGQGFWPDEGRYRTALDAVQLIRGGGARDGLLALVGSGDHLFFKFVALPAAWLDSVFGESPRRAAAYLALFSVCAVALLGSCARAAGASRREAWLAVFLAAASNSFFYYSRHLLPYDVSMAFFMGSLALGLRKGSAWTSFAVGVIAGLGFLTYVGYWLLGAVILVLHVLRAPQVRSAALRAMAAGAGLLLPIVAAVVAAHFLGGDLILSLRKFSATVYQGDFGRGHVFVWQYLWSAEGPMLAVWIAAAAYALLAMRRLAGRGRPLVWLGAAAAVYLGLVASADVLRAFVVYGRTARMIVPFACLASAWSLNGAWSGGRFRPAMVAAGLALVALLAARNFSASFALTFPPRFMEEARRLVGSSPPGAFRIENAAWIGPGGSVDDGRRPGTVLLRRQHPLRFQPYLFEGYNEAQRSHLAGADIDMRVRGMLVRIPGTLGGYTGPLRIRMRFASGQQGGAEPLVATGRGEGACLVYVRYVDSTHVAFGYQRGTELPISSSPMAADYGRDHDVLVSLGSMLPGGAWVPGAGIDRAGWRRLCGSLLVVMDDRTVMAGAVDVPGSPADGTKLGVNLAGLTAASGLFSGTISSIEPVDPSAALGRLWTEQASNLRQDPAWDGFPGPLRLRIVPDIRPGGLGQPLVSTGRGQGASCLYLSAGDDGTARLNYSRFGLPTVRSMPFPIRPDGPLELVVSMPCMMPPADSALYSRSPGISVLRGEMAAAADGRTVLALRGETAVSAPGDVRLFIGTFGSERISTVFQGRIVSEEAADPSVLVSVLPADGREMCGPSLIEKTYPGPISLRVAFPAASEGTVEPLVVTGITGAGDIVYVQYLKDSSARFGLDHWGTGGPVSEAVDLAPPGAAREITVSHSGLLPPPDSEYYERHPECRTLREWVVVAVDGRPVLAARVQCYPSLPEQIATGSNPIGGSTTAARFSGTIEKVESASPELALRWAGGAR